MLGGEDAGTGCAGWGLTALTQDLVSTLSTQWPACYKGGHDFKVRVALRSHLFEVMSSRSKLIRGHVFKVKVD